MIASIFGSLSSLFGLTTLIGGNEAHGDCGGDATSRHEDSSPVELVDVKRLRSRCERLVNFLDSASELKLQGIPNQQRISGSFYLNFGVGIGRGLEFNSGKSSLLPSTVNKSSGSEECRFSVITFNLNFIIRFN